jgi:hypothetical protein
MTMRTAIGCATVLVVFATLCAPPGPAAAATYSPLVHREPGNETLAGQGKTVYLFHSGTEDARRALQVGTQLTVVRVQPSCESVEVGVVRAVAFVGDTYLEAEVVSGAVKPNDIARIGSVSCLVLAAQPCERK